MSRICASFDAIRDRTSKKKLEQTQTSAMSELHTLNLGILKLDFSQNMIYLIRQVVKRCAG